MGISKRFKGVYLCLGFILLQFSLAFGQKDGKADFGAAVDQINCETMKFIHREEGRKNVADKMECFTFESIYKSIPDDEINSTGKLCKEINHAKEKYNPKEDLGKQIDAVIALAYDKIKKKKRKGSVEEYKAHLEEYKKDALESFTAASTPKAEAKTEDKKDNQPKVSEAPKTDSSNAGAATAATESTKSNNSSEILPAEKNANSNSGTMVGWAAIILSLISLILSAFALMRLKHFIDETEARMDEPAPELSRPAAPLVRESPDNYKLLEMKFNDELRNMRTYFENKIAELSTQHNVEKAESADEPQFASSHVIEEGHYIPEELPVPEPSEEKNEAPAENQPEVKFTPPPVQVSLFGDLPLADQAAKSYEDELDTNLLPSYRFAALPVNGLFDENLFTEHATNDSIFEIESYADVPGRAFFSFLNYPEVSAKVLANPQEYLDPYSHYEGSHEGKSRIILVDEGILQLEDGHWHVSTKAHVRFE